MLYHTDDYLKVYVGDCREVMATLPEQSVHCVVTSPPYWGLRDYGNDGQLGLEATPDAYVEAIVGVFREVRRVLRDDGTVWLNLGDSYASQGGHAGQGETSQRQGRSNVGEQNRGSYSTVTAGLKTKDLVGIPWRVAFALQADGWYLRSEIIWAKPNPMPESVTDRPTKAHETVFLLSKSPRYYYDADAVREADSGQQHHRNVLGGAPSLEPSGGLRSPHGALWGTPDKNGTGRNLRSVWTIATEPYPGAHFATFPRKLVEPCVKAGTSERGVCSICGAPWQRMVARRQVKDRDDSTRGDSGTVRRGMAAVPEQGWQVERNTVGWKAGCKHTVADGAVQVPATVLDPFAGTGTVAQYALTFGRRAVLIDLSAEYFPQMMTRVGGVQMPDGTWVRGFVGEEAVVW